ncbi:PAS domain-containing sensor histidine kinase [Chromobacterium sp. IIBBL 290-4]|uniref:sensor histidine kinase n=1 Tax=Chromobacterium sp. IIBBL 290-4 TaxID=2953890 RepID=UPI0020B8E131|nr:HAMP domain-containing sensor histidine kinase [Chromobacterium sp. IIBBL 290-4]UTH75040.1 HAMP domain-containing histidine kinase [Chromobacterium sp. IIBBL 290-4]
MVSEAARWKSLVLSSSLSLIALGGAAVYAVDSPRLEVVVALAAATLLAWQWRAMGHGWRAASLQGQTQDAPMPPELALSPAQIENIRLEHAPVALFRLAADHAEPLNARARRLVAPGYASSPAALYQQLLSHQGERRWIRFETERGVERALVSCSRLGLGAQQERLLALLPLENELEAETLRAWQQLVHVLTHEIMNSLTPVASLSRSASELLDDNDASLPESLRQELELTFHTISRRADSLADFVSSYRSLSSAPEPKPEIVAISQLFERLHALTAPAWRARGGEAVFHAESPSLELRADGGQLEQALINLIKNAFEATAHQPRARLEVNATLARGGRLRLEVADNGPGVPDELIEQIFTPFYSTKAKGRGIGLALVRQLVNSNGGTVRYARKLNGGARLILTF